MGRTIVAITQAFIAERAAFGRFRRLRSFQNGERRPDQETRPERKTSESAKEGYRLGVFRVPSRGIGRYEV